MDRVKTFASPLRIFHSTQELEGLDEQVNRFAKENNIARIISVSDTNTTDSSGATIGIIRVVVYQEPA